MTLPGETDAVTAGRFALTTSRQGVTTGRFVYGRRYLARPNAVEIDPVEERWSYVLLAEELRRVGAEPRRDAAELFRRMSFNALISNIDDHPRNHAIIAPNRGWRLSPAYDLTPSSPVSVERRDLAMACGDLGRYANAGNLLSQAARFLLAPEEAARIVDDMEAQVRSTWYEIARGCGVSDVDCAQISGAFAYPGFRT